MITGTNIILARKKSVLDVWLGFECVYGLPLKSGESWTNQETWNECILCSCQVSTLQLFNLALWFKFFREHKRKT